MAKSKIGAKEELHVVCDGLAPIMFDRYTSIDVKHIAPEDKLYLSEEDGETLVMPAKNILSFLGASKKSCCDVFMGRKRAPYVSACKYAVMIEQQEIPFIRNGKTIKFTGWDKGTEVCASAKVYVDHDKGIVWNKGLAVPVELHRPVLEMPWSLEFDIVLWTNEYIDSKLLQQWITAGGIQIGFGSYRPRFGRFLATVK